MSTSTPKKAGDRAFFGHPRGLSTLFFTELWERFSYYGMRAVLILFMTAPVAVGGLGFDTVRAGAIYGAYVSMVYLLSLPGGWLADRVLGLGDPCFELFDSRMPGTNGASCLSCLGVCTLAFLSRGHL